MLAVDALAPYAAQYAALAPELVPLRVVLTLAVGSSLVSYDPVNLDNLLAAAVVREATRGVGLPDQAAAYALPVPLASLWRSEDGLPLWAATPFRPVGEAAADVHYWHKRAQTGRWTGTRTGQFGIRSTLGRYMERRVPLPTQIAAAWAADAIGEPAEVLRLLATITAVGKRRASGFGTVARWEVVPVDGFALVRDGRLTRPLPAEAAGLLGGAIPEGAAALVGWTPPQWRRDLYRPGWWTDTPVWEPGATDG